MDLRETLRGLDEKEALRAILQGTATTTGEEFFVSLVANLADVLGTYAAWVAEYLPGPYKLRAIAMKVGGRILKNHEMDLAGTPCEAVIEGKRFLHQPDNIVELFPADEDLLKLHGVSYMGVPFFNPDGSVLGHLAVMDNRPMPEEPRSIALFQIFAARAGAELQRLRAEKEVREREERLSRLIDATMDAILELDRDLVITGSNAAASRIFEAPPSVLKGMPFPEIVAPPCATKIQKISEDLGLLPEGEQSQWIPAGLSGRKADGAYFPAEGSLSRYERDGEAKFTVIIRNLDERGEAERKIRALTKETEYLREEIRSLQGFDAILGQSPALLQVLKEVDQVAKTEATVLIHGETGTGKELIARAIHALSKRGGRPLIKVNCAAVPSSLMESEFFGHEAGAFTGATKRREGRFALADESTLFLDEIGEMSLDLQAKLLRVLQEGEFEPVGSSRTQSVDARVIVATNRDLKKEVEAGRFREDLYYRINVVPVFVPPLRDRGDDVLVLARAFAEKFARELGRPAPVFRPADEARLTSYEWPGNIRELHNVIERAVITSSGDLLRLDRALPSAGEASVTETKDSPAEPPILTQTDWKELEKKNIVRALERAEGKVSGPGGAAELLGMKPSTLASRIKALNIS